MSNFENKIVEKEKPLEKNRFVTCPVCGNQYPLDASITNCPACAKSNGNIPDYVYDPNSNQTLTIVKPKNVTTNPRFVIDKGE